MRLDYRKHSDSLPLQALTAISAHLRASGLSLELIELLQLRASQLNGCAYCIDMHSKDLQALGTDSARIHLLPAWRESGVYSPAEQAALGWTEAVTLIADQPDLDGAYEALTRHFGPKEVSRLTFAIIAINSFNRLSIAFGRQPDGYQPGDLNHYFQQALERFGGTFPDPE
jgi:AhpD family alkylhydroperoxidase